MRESSINQVQDLGARIIPGVFEGGTLKDVGEYAGGCRMALDAAGCESTANGRG